MTLQHAFDSFSAPPSEFGPIPFWFWNDDLEERELIRQVHAFHQAGFGGLLPHARIGLSHRIGYLTDEYFRLFRIVVEEAARLDMKIILYDEGSYPSGSARGAVVAENPQFASQAIGLWHLEVQGPCRRFWRPNTGRALLDRPVCALIGQQRPDGSVDSSTVRILERLPHDIYLIDVPAGRWLAMSVWNTQSGGHIRGVFPEEESGSAQAPPAADILNPEAVACFIRLTHDRYFEHLGEFFGNTIIAMFTDEPSILGKPPHRPRNAQPFSPGFVEWLGKLWGYDPRPWLPALWLDFGPETDSFRRRYARAVQQRLEEVFYRAQSDWCESHGIALTGHPAASEEMSCLRYFQLPGQDMVWRYVEPGKPTALEGRHSVAAKAATSAARLRGARRILTEVCGAYGWSLTLEEVKWLFDWHLVRGNNLINPHALFYSIRGRRAWESEPDLGLHNPWWPYFPKLVRYAARISWLLCDGEQICDVAVLGDGNNLPWEAARQLYQRQIDFLYIDEEAVATATVEDGGLVVGVQTYCVVVSDRCPDLSLDAQRKLEHFVANGGLLVDFDPDLDLPAAVDILRPANLVVSPPNPGLRYQHYRRGGLHFFLLVNESEEQLGGTVRVGVAGKAEIWDALSGRRRQAPAREDDGRLFIDIALERRESAVLAIDPAAPFSSSVQPVARPAEEIPLDQEWEVRDLNGHKVAAPAPGDWAKYPGLELFSGTLSYSSRFSLDCDGEASIDLGEVGDLAQVFIDDRERGVALWAPYRLELGNLCQGFHDLEIRVTNSMANACEGIQRASGLLSPVRLVLRPTQPGAG